MELSPGVIALIGTLFGGVGLKLVETWLSRSRHEVSDAAQIRNELRLSLESKNEEIAELEAQVDRWRGLYYDLRDLKIQVETELRIVKAQLEEMRIKLERIEEQTKS